jgi:diacylglycerol diphosphate phosphatase/phosphatidate phosphatase
LIQFSQLVGFAGLFHLSLYFAGKLKIFVVKTGYFYRGFIVLLPIFGGVLVAVSRITDYKHHTWDVVIAALLGTAFAIFAYRQYYPSLWSPYSGIPFEPRIPKGNDISTGDNISMSQRLGADYGNAEDEPQLGYSSATNGQSFEMSNQRVQKPGAEGDGETNVASF